MKLRIFCLLLTVVISLVSCDDEEKPKTLPEVTTATVSDIATNSARLSGEITHDGNTKVTAAGFVYSDVISLPTIADDKIEVTITNDEFSALLEGLKSGTTYHVRSYATNSVGTAYSEAVDFTTANAPPTVTNVVVTGVLEVGKEVTATYTYVDAESDSEGSTTFQWYVANDNTGTGQTPIANATGKTYKVQESDQGKYISAAVTPKAATGTPAGAEVKSAFFGAIGEATTVTFTYNGKQVTYGIIVSSTGRKWLDRNLGAPNVPSSVNDYANYGDLFQWGRLADGHQVILRNGPNDADMVGVNGKTSFEAPFETSSTDNPGHSKFIINPDGFGDWRNPKNDNLWQGVTGVNNPCPSGWRIPTLTEWTAENLVDLTTAFSKLKITYTGVRFSNSGDFAFSATAGRYWTSTVDASVPEQITRVHFNPSYGTLGAARANAYACRCIKN